VRALLDVNVLIAWVDESHASHAAAKRWLIENHRHGWASCPLTQNGCTRILSQPGYGGGDAALPLSAVLARLTEVFSAKLHAFWPDDISLFDATRFEHAHLHGHRQITDAYLLALAVKHGGRFVTFDARIPISAAKGAQAKQLVVL
jgi:uncharacterized protein